MTIGHGRVSSGRPWTSWAATDQLPTETDRPMIAPADQAHSIERPHIQTIFVQLFCLENHFKSEHWANRGQRCLHIALAVRRKDP